MVIEDGGIIKQDGEGVGRAWGRREEGVKRA
jgi:hypothetical protein